MSEAESYEAGVHAAWVGEIVGESLFEELASRATGTPLEQKWRLLAKLEQLMGRRLEPLLARYECDLTPTSEAKEQGVATAKAFASLAHKDFMEALEPYIEDALRRYRALSLTSPSDDAEAMELLVAHEAALLRFVQKERAGDPRDSTTEAREVIDRLAAPS